MEQDWLTSLDIVEKDIIAYLVYIQNCLADLEQSQSTNTVLKSLLTYHHTEFNRELDQIESARQRRYFLRPKTHQNKKKDYFYYTASASDSKDKDPDYNPGRHD